MALSRIEVVLVRAGELRHRVTIQQKSISQDTYGAALETWSTLATVWANVEALSGREFFDSQQTVAQADHRITIRYRADIKPAMRVVEGTRTFEIQAVLDREGRKRTLELLCREVV